MAPGRFMGMVFDAHCHVGHWGRHVMYGRVVEPFSGRGFSEPAAFGQHFRHQGLAGAVVVPTYTPDNALTFSLNELVLRCAKAMGRAVVPGFWVDPSPSVRKMLQAALELAAEHHVRVLKTFPDAWGSGYGAAPETWDTALRSGMRMIEDYALEEGCIVQIHTGGGPSDVRAVKQLMRCAPPGVRFHLVHMGGRAAGHFYLVPRLSEWLSQGIDFTCDTSGAAGWAVRWVVSAADRDESVASRVMFASDEPWFTYEAELAKVAEATRGNPGLWKRVAFGNAQATYGPLALSGEAGENANG